jgi:CRISPR system Cascade subunit CasD
MGVRVDQEGLLQKDFQTTQDVIVASGKGWENQISNRYFLSDAAFLVGLEGEGDMLRHLHKALANPFWPLFLGRKSHVPSPPTYLHDGLMDGADLRSALMNYPLLGRSKKQEKIRLVLESSSITHESRTDSPISFSFGRREFRERFVNTEFLPAEAFPRKEDDNVSYKARA